MKSLLLSLTFLLALQVCGQVPTTNTPLQVLSQQGPNLSAWVLAPIDRSIPDQIRQNIIFLREDLVDEGKAKPRASVNAYSAAYQFCSNLIAALDEREKMLLKAGYRAVQANVVTPATNQALEARRNYMMSWPQYEREVQQRNDLLRVGEAADQRKVELALQELKLEWANRATPLRTNLDALYMKLRAALRESGVTSQTFDGSQNVPKGTMPAPAQPTSIPTSSKFGKSNTSTIEPTGQFVEHIHDVFPVHSGTPIRLARDEKIEDKQIYDPPKINGEHLTQGQFISTNALFRPPVEICVEAMTNPHDLRLSYAADQIIFSWGGTNEFRIDGGIANGLHKSHSGSFPRNKYAKIRWVVLPNRQTVWVNDELRFDHQGDYSQINKRVSVFCVRESVVWVKSLKIRKLDSQQLPAIPLETLPSSSNASSQETMAPASIVPATVPPTSVPKATFTNSLGMKFIPVPDTDVLFCIHETRRQDYEAYAKQIPGLDDSWKNQQRSGIPCGHKDDHPVVGITWEDSVRFCEWLSKKEGKSYRLPTDREWSIAVGLGQLEPHEGQTPDSLSRKVMTHFPWGSNFPPNIEDRAGNYAGNEDGFPTTAPVMSFRPNNAGLYDMGGNVWEWCQDRLSSDTLDRVLRGCSFWHNSHDHLLSSHRDRAPGNCYSDRGFRCILDLSGSSSKTSSSSTQANHPTASFVPAATGTKSPSSIAFTNSLGMKFVNVPGTNILMCIHETRNADYAAYAASKGSIDNSWKEGALPGREQHPVTKVNYYDAKDFCAWLSRKENQSYRIPTDAEWSLAAGLVSETGDTPEEKDRNGPLDIFPWGDHYPPRPEDGNYRGMFDGYETTSPVMSFKANNLGIYDLGGNADEWCEEMFGPDNKIRVLRGGSFISGHAPTMRSACRSHDPAVSRYDPIHGFRCVLDLTGSSLEK